MAFVKLDTGILDSTLWVERECREIFITALLLAQPFETEQPMPQIAIRQIEHTGFVVPPGWYGFVHAAGPGIIRRAMVDVEAGYVALEKLGSADPESRSSDFEGRRLVRVDGGYLVLNYMKYRDRDHTSATRSARYRERKKATASHRDVTASHRDITQADAYAEADVNLKSKPKAHRFALPPWIPDEAWQGFEAMRQKIRKPMTDRARSMIVKELETLKAQGFDPVAVLAQSEVHSWAGVFPIKSNGVSNGNGNGKFNVHAASRAALHRAIADEALARNMDEKVVGSGSA